MKTMASRVQDLSAPSVKSSVHPSVWGIVLALLGYGLESPQITPLSYLLSEPLVVRLFPSLGNLSSMHAFPLPSLSEPKRAAKAPISLIFPNPKTKLCTHYSFSQCQ